MTRDRQERSPGGWRRVAAQPRALRALRAARRPRDLRDAPLGAGDSSGAFSREIDPLEEAPLGNVINGMREMY